MSRAVQAAVLAVLQDLTAEMAKHSDWKLADVRDYVVDRARRELPPMRWDNIERIGSSMTKVKLRSTGADAHLWLPYPHINYGDPDGPADGHRVLVLAQHAGLDIVLGPAQ